MILQPAAWLLDWKQILFSAMENNSPKLFQILQVAKILLKFYLLWHIFFWHSFFSILEFWCFDPDFLLAGILGCIETTRD